MNLSLPTQPTDSKLLGFIQTSRGWGVWVKLSNNGSPPRSDGQTGYSKRNPLVLSPDVAVAPSEWMTFEE